METTLLRAKSHRARERLERLTTVTCWCTIGDGHFYEIPSGDLDAALRIPGIGRARKPRARLFTPWKMS